MASFTQGRLLTAVLVLLSYAFAAIVMGHGAVTVVMVFLMEAPGPWWFLVKATGAVGVIGFIIATVLVQSDTKTCSYQSFTSIALYASWLLGALLGNRESGSFWSSFILSAPLQIAFLCLAGRVVAPLTEYRAGRQR